MSHLWEVGSGKGKHLSHCLNWIKDKNNEWAWKIEEFFQHFNFNKPMLVVLENIIMQLNSGLIFFHRLLCSEWEDLEQNFHLHACLCILEKIAINFREELPTSVCSFPHENICSDCSLENMSLARCCVSSSRFWRQSCLHKDCRILIGA